MTIIDQLNRWVGPLKKIIQSLIIKGILSAVNDSKSLQLIRVTIGKNEALSNVERVQPFGLSSYPPLDSEVVLLCAGGSREKAVAICIENSSSRVKNQEEGEVNLYIDSLHRIQIRPNGEINIIADKVNIQSGEIRIGDGLLHKSLATEDFVEQVYKLHVHPAPGGTTSAPTPIPMPTELTSKTKVE